MKRPQLFLLHFAGGNCYSFQFLTSRLKDFDVVPLELPGRGRRLKENLLKEFDQAAGDIFNQVMEKLTSDNFLIYGHSMGAYLALRITNMLAEKEKFPICLFVSGNAGPDVRENKNRYLLAHDDFIAELKKLGGVPPEFTENKELFDFFEPILRADFEIAERNNMKDEQPVSVPLYAMMGSEELHVDKIANWARFTLLEFDYEVLPGDHFFIYDHPEKLAGIIKQNYKRMAMVPQL